MIPGSVTSETEVVYVPKGDKDVSLVYTGTSCGLNNVIWVSQFAIPTDNSLLQAVEARSCIGGGDIKDQFHSFMLHSSL